MEKLSMADDAEDGSEGNRRGLDLLRPHLCQAYRNAAVLRRLQQELAALRQAVEAWQGGVIVLEPGGRVRMMTPLARRWLAEYFGSRRRRAGGLPEVLHRWVRHQEALLADTGDMPPSRKPMVVEREDKRLVVRVLADADRVLLLLEELQRGPQASVLEAGGLSRREAEVLRWVAAGKTNWEIGMILGLSPRTVQKHLEHIFAKLGVENRTAAATWWHHRTWERR
jgi:DNA-binding CsgD family transcriptional regulator